jgi:hypothetical protein
MSFNPKTGAGGALSMAPRPTAATYIASFAFFAYIFIGNFSLWMREKAQRESRLRISPAREGTFSAFSAFSAFIFSKTISRTQRGIINQKF